MGTKHDKTPMSAMDLDRIATSLAYFSQRYREVASQMEVNNIEELEVTGIKTLIKTTLPFLQGAVSSATTALDRAILGSSETVPIVGKPSARQRAVFFQEGKQADENLKKVTPQEKNGAPQPKKGAKK